MFQYLQRKLGKHLEHLILKQKTQCFTLFTGQIGKLLGEVNIQVKLNSLTTNHKIFIALGVKQNIQGRDWIFQLNLENESLPKIQRFETKWIFFAGSRI